MIEIKPGQIWKHSKKGGTYKIIALAKHSETLEDMVVYEALYHNPTAKIWTRPLASWQEIVEINGEPKPRFGLVED
ncbi:MAG: DUF1653 domain-containing protein [Patescibacteria group bacterium]